MTLTLRLVVKHPLNMKIMPRKAIGCIAVPRFRTLTYPVSAKNEKKFSIPYSEARESICQKNGEYWAIGRVAAWTRLEF